MFRQAAFVGMLLMGILAVAALAAADDLAAGFANPPDACP